MYVQKMNEKNLSTIIKFVGKIIRLQNILNKKLVLTREVDQGCLFRVIVLINQNCIKQRANLFFL